MGFQRRTEKSKTVETGLSPSQIFPLIFPFRRRSRTEPSGINCPIFLAGHGQGARSGTEGFRKNTVPYSSSLATRTMRSIIKGSEKVC